MKKLIAISLALTMIAGLPACAGSKTYTKETPPASTTPPEKLTDDNTITEPTVPSEPTEPTIPEKTDKVPNSNDGFTLYEESKNYQIYRHADKFQTYYIILNNNGILMDVGYDAKDVRIEQNGDIVQVTYNLGMSNRGVKYYDVGLERESVMFHNPLAINGDLVAKTMFIGDTCCLVVRQMFDPTVYYKVFSLDPKPNSAVQFEAFFTDSEHIELTYSTASGMVTQTFNLSEDGDDLSSFAKTVLTIKNALDQKKELWWDNLNEVTPYETDYSIKYQSTTHISILYELTFNVNGTAHPTYIEFGINMDIFGNLLKLQDIISVDKTFIEKFRTQWNIQCDEALLNYLEQYSDEELLEMFQNADPVISDISFYMTDDGITILFPVPYAAGSYVHIALSK